MYLGWRDLKAAKGRFALVGVVIALVALLTTLLTGLAGGLVDDGISGLRALPLTNLAFQAGAKSTFSRSSLDSEALAAWTKHQPNAAVSPLGVSFVNARTPKGTTIDIALWGIAPGSFLAPRPEAQRALGEAGIVLSDEFRGKVNVGDVVTVIGPDVELPILGFTYAGSYGHVDIGFTSLETWQKLTFGDNHRDRFSAIAIRSDATDFAATDKASGTTTVTKEEAYDGSPGYAAETQTMDLIRGFLLVISALIVGAFFTVWTIQRTRQVGLLKALGASNRYVLRDAVGQLVIVLVAATALGVAVAVGLGALVGSGVPFHLQAGPVLAATAALVVLGLAGSAVAIRKIAAVDPAIALGSES